MRLNTGTTTSIGPKTGSDMRLKKGTTASTGPKTGSSMRLKKVTTTSTGPKTGSSMRLKKGTTTSTGPKTGSDMRLKKVENEELRDFLFHQLHSVDEKIGMCRRSGEITSAHKSGIGILTGIYHFIHF